MASTLWPKPSYFNCFNYSVNCEQSTCFAHVYAILFRCIIHIVECLCNVLVQSLVNLILCPIVPTEVLQPFKVRYGDSASICENVRNYQNLVFVENVVCFC